MGDPGRMLWWLQLGAAVMADDLVAVALEDVLVMAGGGLAAGGDGTQLAGFCQGGQPLDVSAMSPAKEPLALAEGRLAVEADAVALNDAGGLAVRGVLPLLDGEAAAEVAGQRSEEVAVGVLALGDREQAGPCPGGPGGGCGVRASCGPCAPVGRS